VRLGYAFHGFLSDRKIKDGVVVSTPDGNSTYSWSILWEAQKRGWETWLLQEDRDAEYVNVKKTKAFEAFSRTKRYSAWKKSKKTITTKDTELVSLDDLPKLDIVLIEWRFPIEGRNVGIGRHDPNYQPDYDRQEELLTYFAGTDTKVILWDLDHKLTLEDELKWDPDAIFETSVRPLTLSKRRVRVEPPIVVEDLLQFPTMPCLPGRKLVYIGSRYERDDVIDKWVKPVSEMFPFQVEFWGNWTRPETLDQCRQMWPNVLYNGRITVEDFREVYGTAVACPLLGKKSYLSNGFITPRPWEALLFGTIPVGLEPHLGIDQYVLSSHLARNEFDLIEIVERLSKCNVAERDALRKKNVEQIGFMDVSNFVDKLVDVVEGG